MTSRPWFTFAALALIACDSSHDASLDATSSALVDCPSGIRLPDVRVDGPVGPNPTPPQPRRGTSLGVVRERSPFGFDYGRGATYEPSSGLRQSGWTVEGRRGERFAYAIALDRYQSWKSVRLRVFGPIAGCRGESAGEAALQLDRGTWTAPEDGEYFVTPRYELHRGSDGQIRAVEERDLDDRVRVSFRRLLDDGTPAGHALVEVAAGWRFYSVGDAQLARVDGSLAVVAAGTYLIGEWTPRQEPRLVVARPGTLAAPTVLAAPHPTGALLVDDFSNDGRTDVLWGWNLYESQADGSFTVAALPYPMTSSDFAGTLDLDGDGWKDLVFVRIQPTGDPSHPASLIFARPYFRRGSSFAAGGMHTATVPIAAYFSNFRGGLHDVSGDARPEIVVALSGPSASSASDTRVVAFQAPRAQTGDGPLIEVATDPARLPPIAELDRRGPRLTDLDGDGSLDFVAARRHGFSQEVLLLAYGQESGAFELPWEYVSATQGGNDAPLLDHGDFDGDGCTDVLLGGAGLSLFRGLRCQ